MTMHDQPVPKTHGFAAMRYVGTAEHALRSTLRGRDRASAFDRPGI